MRLSEDIKRFIGQLRFRKPVAAIATSIVAASLLIAPTPAAASPYTLSCTKTSNATANTQATSVSDTPFTMSISGTQLIKGTAFQCAGVATIPQGITSVEFGAFVPWDMSNRPLSNHYLTSFVWPTSVTAINLGLINLRGLTTLDIPSSVTSIAGQSFQSLSSLTSATIQGPTNQANPLTLPAYTFNDTVTALTIGDGYVNFGPYFNNGAVFTSITLGPNVRTIGTNAFANSNDNRSFKSITISAGVTTIADGAFANNRYLKTVSFGTGSPGITSIAANAFGQKDGGTATVLERVQYCGLIDPALRNAVLDSYIAANLPNVNVYCSYSTNVPTISNINPSVGVEAGGNVVTIQGTNLSDAKVYLAGTEIAVANNTATSLQFTTPQSTVGTKAVRVVTNFGSASSTFSYVDKIPNPITISSTPQATNYVGGTYTPAATAPGGSVSATVATASSSVCSMSVARVVTFNAVGSCVVLYDQAGDANYATTQAQQAITVSPFVITTRNVVVAAPVTNATPQTTIADNGQYTATIAWSGSPSVFAANTVYAATVTIVPKTNWSLTGVTANFFTVNGSQATSGNLANAGTFTYSFPATSKATITTRNVVVTAPVIGATPQTTIADNGQYTASVSWNGNPTTFAANTTYTATVNIVPKSEYSLTGVVSNFFTVNGNAATIGNQLNAGSFSFTFPAYWQMSFVPNGGTGLQSAQFFQTGGTPVVLPSTTSFTAPTGKVFAGWATSATSSTPVTAAYQSAAAITYYAIWSQLAHTVTFDINGGDGSQTMASQTLSAPSNLRANTYTYTDRFFLGWNTAADGTGTQYADQAQYQFLANTTLYAQWGKVVTYRTTGADSGSPSRASDNWTSGVISLPTKGTMVKAGYSFAGWSDGTTTYTTTFTPSTIFALTPVWTANTYTISFSKTGGATGSVPSNQSWTTGTAPLTLAGNIGSPALSRTGYTFGGWATALAPTTPVTTYSSFSDQNFIPIWTPVAYTVTYSLNGASGAAPTQPTLNINQSFTLPTPSRASYAFVGWLLDGTSDTYSSGFTLTIGASSATSMTFTAQWVAQYTVTYAMNGSTTVQNNPSNVGLFTAATVITLPDTPDLIAGHTFAGWKDSNNVLHPAAGSFTVIQDSVLRAQWTPISYTVTYSLGLVTGTAPSSSATTINSTFNIAAAPSKPGYIFLNWNTASDGTGSGYLGNQAYSVTAAANVSFTAQWVRIPYSVTYDLGGGTGTLPATLTDKYVGDTFTLPSSGSNPTWRAYTFLHWSDGTNSFAPGATYTLGAGSVTLTAVFQRNGTTPIAYSFGSNPGSGTLPTQNAELEGTIITLKSGAGLTRSGHTFAGWTDGSNAYQAGESYVVPIYSNPVTLSPIWNTGFTVTYSSGTGAGPVPTDGEIRFRGNTFVVQTQSPSLVKASFTFNGWNDGVNTYKPGSTYTVVSSNILLTAQWIQNSYFAALGTPMVELSHKTLRPGVGYPLESFSVGSSAVSYTIPADAFGAKTDNMDFRVYALSDASTLASILPSNQTYILPTIISWLAADGTVPDALIPLTQTITSSQIRAGTTAYAITGTTYQILGVATQDGSITISITEDPLIVLGNPVVQTVSNGGGSSNIGSPIGTVWVPSFNMISRPLVTVVGQVLTLSGANLGDITVVRVGGKEAKILKKSAIEIMIDVPTELEGLQDVEVFSPDGAMTFTGLLRVLKPYADKRTQMITKFTGNLPTKAGLAALQKMYLASPTANLLSCVVSVAVNATASQVSKAKAQAKATCDSVIKYARFIKTAEIQVLKVGKSGSTPRLSVTFDRTLLGS